MDRLLDIAATVTDVCVFSGEVLSAACVSSTETWSLASILRDAFDGSRLASNIAFERDVVCVAVDLFTKSVPGAVLVGSHQQPTQVAT